MFRVKNLIDYSSTTTAIFMGIKYRGFLFFVLPSWRKKPSGALIKMAEQAYG
jgi:hypothetical protein